MDSDVAIYHIRNNIYRICFTTSYNRGFDTDLTEAEALYLSKAENMPIEEY